MCCTCGREVCLDCYHEWDDVLEIGQENVDSCSKKRRHTKRQMVPFSFAKEGELEGLMKDLEHLPRQMSQGIIESTEYPKSRTEGFLPFIKAKLSSIHEKDFRKLWNLSQPLVVTSCLDNFEISWTPEYFIDNYGKEQCFLVDCDTEQYVKSTVGKFFEEFSMSDAKRPLKLKVCSP